MEISKEELQQILATAVGAAVAEVKKMNPIEQEQFDKQVEEKKRKRQFMAYLGRIEEEAMRRRRFGCSHSRWPSGHKLAGHPCPRGQGEWTTGGQMHGKGIATVICTRCATTWIFRASADETQAIIDGGLAGMAPPDESVCLHQRCNWCSEFFTHKEFSEHDVKACKAKAESFSEPILA